MFEFSDETLSYFFKARDQAGEFSLQDKSVKLLTFGDKHSLVGWRLFLRYDNQKIADIRYQVSGSVCAIAVIALIAEILLKNNGEVKKIDFDFVVAKLNLTKAQYPYAVMAEEFVQKFLYN